MGTGTVLGDIVMWKPLISLLLLAPLGGAQPTQFWLFASLSPGYKPLSPSKGTWLLGDPFFLLAQGLGGGICHELSFVVPPVPVIIGLDVWLQGARRDVGPVGPITLTNAVCLTITGPGAPCVSPGC